jgi:hypothetical protein
LPQKPPNEPENLEPLAIYQLSIRLRATNDLDLTDYRTESSPLELTKILLTQELISDPITQAAQWGRIAIAG